MSRIGLDTNVLVRYLTQDDPAQSEAANRIMSSLSARKSGLVTLTVLIELVWVLRACYGRDDEAIAGILCALLSVPELEIEQRALIEALVPNVYPALHRDFSDCVIAAMGAQMGATMTLSFDKRMAERLPDVRSAVDYAASLDETQP